MARFAPVADAAVLALFVSIGRSVHADGLTIVGFASTVWPFAVGFGLGWLVILRRGAYPAGIPAGTAVWLATVTAGMVLRVAAGQGIALAFVFVALGFLGATMLGWRLLLLAWRHRRIAGRRRA